VRVVFRDVTDIPLETGSGNRAKAFVHTYDFLDFDLFL
jgi:hypothetical protein